MKHFLYFLLFFSFCSSLICCKNISSNLEKETIYFSLPTFPTELEDEQTFDLTWQIEIFSADFSDSFYTTENTVKCNVKKNVPFGILATPIITFSNNNKSLLFYKPAGKIYPYSDFSLSWEEGFCASLMKQLILNGKENCLDSAYIEKFLSSFNWKKLTETIHSKTEEKANNNSFFNPWQIDCTSLLDELSYGQFSATLLNPKSVYHIEIPKPLETNKKILSSYVPENIFINKSKKLTVQKDCLNSYLIDDNFLALVSYSSAKKISVTKVSLPIYNLEL